MPGEPVKFCDKIAQYFFAADVVASFTVLNHFSLKHCVKYLFSAVKVATCACL